MTRHVAICNRNVQPNIKTGYSFEAFSLNGIQLPCGVIETPRKEFNSSAKENLEKVFIRKKAFSCNYRDKALALNVLSLLEHFGEMKKPKFYALGSEYSGEVVAVGDHVKGFEIGDRVIPNGCYPKEHPDTRDGLQTNHGSKEFDALHQTKLIKMPSNMSWEVAAGFTVGAQTTYSMIRRLDMQPGDKILVTGASSNTSLFAINALKKYDVEIYALTTRDTFKQELLDLGVKEVFVVDLKNPLAEDSALQKFVLEHGLFDLAIDPFCDIYIRTLMDVLKFEGKYISCGIYSQHDSMAEDSGLYTDLNKALKRAILKNIIIMGNCLGTTQDLQNAIDDYEQGGLSVIIDQRFSANQVKEFFDRSFNAKERFGKVIYSYN